MRFSASQVDTYEDCPRKWAFRYIDEVFVQSNAAAEFGTTVHGHLESWFKGKDLPPDDAAGIVAYAMIPHLPAPQIVEQHPDPVEREFSVTLGGHTFIGFVDLFLTSGDQPPIPIIYDHKTTGDFRWAKAPEDLIHDVQATLYAYWAFIHKRDAEKVHLQWTYGLRSPSPRVLPVVRTVTKKEIEPRLLRTVESAKEMALIKEHITQAIDVPYDATACEHFGGCPFIQKCNLTPQERMLAIMSQGETKQSFLEKLKNRKLPAVNPPEAVAPAAPVAVAPASAPTPAAAPVAVAPAPAPATAPVAATPAGGGNPLLSRLRNRGNGAAQVPLQAPVPQPPPVVVEAAPVAAPVAASETDIPQVVQVTGTIRRRGRPPKEAASPEEEQILAARAVYTAALRGGHSIEYAEAAVVKWFELAEAMKS